MNAKINHANVLVVAADDMTIVTHPEVRDEALVKLKATDSCYGYYFLADEDILERLFAGDDVDLDDEDIGREGIDWTGFQG